MLVQIALDRSIGEIAQALKDESDLVHLDQTPDLLDCFRRAVAIIQADQIDLAAINAASVVEPLEIGKLCPTNRAIG